MAAIAQRRPEYTFDLDDWAAEVKNAVVVCPHAVTHNLTPWEIEVLDTNQMRKEARPTSDRTAIQVCLEYEFTYFKELKRKISGNMLTRDEFKKSGFNVVYAILKNIFSAKTPHLLHALLQVPERVQFSGGNKIKTLFEDIVTKANVQKIFGMIRRRYAQRGLTEEENGAILAFTRMASVQNSNVSLKAQAMGRAQSGVLRGTSIGMAALREPLPLAGRHAGTSTAFDDSDRDDDSDDFDNSDDFGSDDIDDGGEGNFAPPVKNNLMLL